MRCRAGAPTRLGIRAGKDGRLRQNQKALVGIRGDGGTSHHQSRDEGAEQGFAAAPGVVHELEEGEVERKLLL